MKVFYSPYTLTPLRSVNRLSSSGKKQGVFLKGVLGSKMIFADYFPHEPLGDKGLDEFLEFFKFQNDEYDKKVFDLLLKDHEFQNLKAKTVFCHELWDGISEIQGSLLKYKILHEEDYTYLKALKLKKHVRLDANGLFTKPQFDKYILEIDPELLPLIKYIEDPQKDTDWKDSKLKTARDFIKGDPFDFTIYKPNSEFKPTNDKPIIYSSYLGSSFGNWHSYCELALNGDLKLHHGVAPKGVYQEETYFFEGDFAKGFIPMSSVVKRMYQDLTHKSWKLLCSI